MDLYISKWWGNYIGGCDDSLLLLDYLESRSSTELSLREIMDGINLTTALESKDWENVSLSWKIKENFHADFDLVVTVVIDLSAIVLESLKDEKVDLNLLDPKYHKKLTLKVEPQSLALLFSGLSFFIESESPYCGFGDVMNLKEVEELIQDCKEIREELKSYL